MIQYPFAIDEAGVLTSIDSVDAEHRHAHLYRCPECGGEMRPRLGQQRAHCFYHADGHECDVESYVHKVGKELLCKRFLIDGIPFKYKRVVHCSRYSSCVDKLEWLCEREEIIVNEKPNSQQKEHSLFDALAYKFLSDYYDVAEIEKAFGDFRPDVLLTSTKHPDRPFFLEVCYKHPCSEEKKASGYPIMEVTVSRVDDLKLIQSVDVFSSLNTDCPLKVVFYGMRPKLLPVEDYMKADGLQRRDFPCTDEYKRSNSNLFRVSFFPSGKTYRRNVISIDEAHNEKAVFEITYDCMSFPGSFCPEELVARRNPLFRICGFCCNCITNWDENTWCKNVLNGSTRKGTFDKFKARKCGAFIARGMSPEETFDTVNYDSYLPGRDFDYWFNPQFPSDMAPIL